jgi:hypothetical protein
MWSERWIVFDGFGCGCKDVVVRMRLFVWWIWMWQRWDCPFDGFGCGGKNGTCPFDGFGCGWQDDIVHLMDLGGSNDEIVHFMDLDVVVRMRLSIWVCWQDDIVHPTHVGVMALDVVVRMRLSD